MERRGRLVDQSLRQSNTDPTSTKDKFSGSESDATFLFEDPDHVA